MAEIMYPRITMKVLEAKKSPHWILCLLALNDNVHERTSEPLDEYSTVCINTVHGMHSLPVPKQPPHPQSDKSEILKS